MIVIKSLWLWAHVSELVSIIENINFKNYQTIWIGYSGGIDSSVLLKLLSSIPSLKHKLKAIHINHNIQKQSSLWQQHCQLFCQELKIPFEAKVIEPEILSNSDNLEQRARKARYEVFEKIITIHDCLLLGHHLQDQSETVLLRLFRGAGIDGLAAMKSFSKRKHLKILRPLLNTSKSELINYAKQHKIKWIEDQSNQDSSFDRNFIRNELLPLIKTRYPSIDKNLSRTATICFETQNYLELQINNKLQACLLENNNLLTEKLLEFSFYEQILIVRAWLKKLNIKMPTKDQLTLFLKCLKTSNIDKLPLLMWGKNKVQFYKKQLYYYNIDISEVIKSPIMWPEPYKDIFLKNTNKNCSLIQSENSANIFIKPNSILELRFRQNGETIKVNGMTKKIKKLLQELEIPPWHREFIPLLYINNELAAISNLIIADQFNIKAKNNFSLKIANLHPDE